MTWEDAKFSTIPNLIILVVSISSFGNYRFQKMVDRESIDLIANETNLISTSMPKNDLSELPDVVKKWLLNSGIIEGEKTSSVYLK